MRENKNKRWIFIFFATLFLGFIGASTLGNLLNWPDARDDTKLVASNGGWKT